MLGQADAVVKPPPKNPNPPPKKKKKKNNKKTTPANPPPPPTQTHTQQKPEALFDKHLCSVFCPFQSNWTKLSLLLQFPPSSVFNKITSLYFIDDNHPLSLCQNSMFTTSRQGRALLLIHYNPDACSSQDGVTI